MNETWELFFDQKNKLLQKNKIGDNDLFVNPIDINDNNIPNGNSVFLNLCNKMNLITKENHWLDKTEILKKTFHSLINYNSTQMFSYIKVLDVYEDNITVTINSKNPNTVEKVKEQTIKKFMDKATIIYKEDNNEEYFIICKKQTCSPKLKNLEEVKNYFNNL